MRREPMALGINPKVWTVLTVIVLSVVFSGLAMGQDHMSQDQLTPAGEWQATTQGLQGDMTITLVLEETDGHWSGHLVDPDDQAPPLEELRVTGNRVQFKLPLPVGGIKASFSATLDETGKFLTGTLSVPQMSRNQDLKFHRVVNSVEENGVKKYTVGSGPAGVWLGKVRDSNGEESQVKLVLDNESGDYVATLEAPFAAKVQGEEVKVNDTMISFIFRPEGSPFPSNFTGTYVAAKDRVSGSFSQRGVSRFVKFKRDPSTVILGVGPDGEIIEPARVRHLHNFGLTGRLSYWSSLHLVKDEVYNLNTLTSGQLNYDGTLRWWAMDAFALFGRLYRGGQGFTDDPQQLALFEGIGLNSESTMKLDGWEVGMTGYLGNILDENSHFNPYFTGTVGKVDWEVNHGARGTEVLAIDEDLLQGKDWSFGVGLGTEYEVSPRLNLEFEWMWRYFSTEDTIIWIDPDHDWSNTHVWALSAGATFMFF